MEKVNRMDKFAEMFGLKYGDTFSLYMVKCSYDIGCNFFIDERGIYYRDNDNDCNIYIEKEQYYSLIRGDITITNIVSKTEHEKIAEEHGIKFGEKLMVYRSKDIYCHFENIVKLYNDRYEYMSITDDGEVEWQKVYAKSENFNKLKNGNFIKLDSN